MAFTDTQRREHIMQLQNALYELGKSGMDIPRVNPDGIYGPETTRAVQEFQRQNNLPATGRTDRDTWNAIFETYFSGLRASNSPLSITPFITGPIYIRRGQTGSGVGLAQVMIWALSRMFANIHAVPITFVYDDATIQQMRNVRRMSSLPDGEVLDVPAWNALVILYNLTASRGF